MEKTLRAVKVEGQWYGLEDITAGNADAHWRYKTRDGEKHRSQRAAVAHMRAQSVQRLAQAWGARVG